MNRPCHRWETLSSVDEGSASGSQTLHTCSGPVDVRVSKSAKPVVLVAIDGEPFVFTAQEAVNLAAALREAAGQIEEPSENDWVDPDWPGPGI